MTGSDASAAVAAVTAATATAPVDEATLPARFALELRPEQEAAALEATAAEALGGLGARVGPLSNLERRVLVVELPGRVLVDTTAAFAAGHALAEAFDLRAAEPDLPTPFFPEEQPAHAGPFVEEGLGSFPPGCWAPGEPMLADDWALRVMRVPEAWASSERAGRPSRGDGVVVAQPDTGVTPHAELAGALRVAGFDVLNGDPDPSDPLGALGNPGHGTATASVLISPTSLRVTGSAPRARLMPIRAMQSVVRVSQVTVARSIDWAVDHGAHVVTMSLGGIPSFSLHRALRRAVAADVILLAAAGNCVREVVWPARYDDCIAVAGTDAADAVWRGSCHGAAVDVSAPAQNVLRAAVPGGQVGQGQGTSFAVALTAGVAALWLAHHGRANLVAAARARGETLQAMFRRLLGATARRPPVWDAFAFGPGVVNAEALLAADLDLGRDRESVEFPADPRERAALSVQSLVAQTVGPAAAADDALDWHRFGPELAAALLEGQLAVPPPDGGPGAPVPETPPPPVTPQLAAAVTNPALRDRLRLDEGVAPEVGAHR